MKNKFPSSSVHRFKWEFHLELVGRLKCNTNANCELKWFKLFVGFFVVVLFLQWNIFKIHTHFVLFQYSKKSSVALFCCVFFRVHSTIARTYRNQVHVITIVNLSSLQNICTNILSTIILCVICARALFATRWAQLHSIHHFSSVYVCVCVREIISYFSRILPSVGWKQQ